MVIDGSSVAKVSKTSRQIHHGAKVGHACAIRARDEGVGRPAAVNPRRPYHLTHVVDPVGVANDSPECAENGHAYAIRARDEGTDWS